jgi:hypothetical protein
VQDVSAGGVNGFAGFVMSVVTYQLFHKRDERLQIFFEREMELVTVFEVDGNYECQ